MASMSDFTFSRTFRMSRDGFYELLTKVHPILKRDSCKAINSSGSPVLPVTKLAATLRFLAGGSYLDIAAMFGLDDVNFFHPNYVLWENAALPHLGGFAACGSAAKGLGGIGHG